MKKIEKLQMEQKAREELLNLMEAHGHTVYTKLEHVSKSGMTRRISCLVQNEEGYKKDITDLVASVTSFKDTGDGLKVTGCGMDMGFHVVYSLSNNLYNTEGYTRDGAYKLNQKWM